MPKLFLSPYVARQGNLTENYNGVQNVKQVVNYSQGDAHHSEESVTKCFHFV